MSLLKKNLDPFRGLSVEAKFTITYAKLIGILVFVTHRLAFQILPRIYSCCGPVAENVSVKKTHKNV